LTALAKCSVCMHALLATFPITQFAILPVPQVQSLSTQPRFNHSATAISLCPGLVEVITFGGCPEWPRNNVDLPQIAKTTVLRFGESMHACMSQIHAIVVRPCLLECTVLCNGDIKQSAHAQTISSMIVCYSTKVDSL
jgi:hypothetical protein